jgi:hypothetical protein
MTSKQVATLRRLLNAKYQEYWKQRKELANKKAAEKFEKAKKDNAHLLQEYKEAKDALDKVEAKAKKVGLGFTSYASKLEFYDRETRWNDNHQRKIEAELRSIKNTIDERLIRLELESEGTDAIKVFEELTALFKL